MTKPSALFIRNRDRRLRVGDNNVFDRGGVVRRADAGGLTVEAAGVLSRVCAMFATALAAVGLAAVFGVSSAQAAFGDNFGLSKLNDGPGPAQEAPAMPEAGHAFWAGTCDRQLVPAFGDAIPGGIGDYPANVFSPGGETNPSYVSVAAPSSPADCIDWGTPSAPNVAGSELPWSRPPSWRLAPATAAGGHPDGTTNFAMEREPDGAQMDGVLDNIVVDLPPGFVGDPNAVAKCTAEQFSARPLGCPPQTQVGVLHLEIMSIIGGANAPNGSDRTYPVYNLEPRKGNVAELGFGYASGEDAVTVRIVAKARTNSDYGVTAFVGQIPGALQVRSQQITIWGVPWAASNDVWRAPTDLKPRPSSEGCAVQPGLSQAVSTYLPPSGLTAPGCAQSYDPSWGPIKPFFSNLTECTGGGLSTRLAIDSFQHPGNFVSDGRPADAVSGKFGAANGDPDVSDPDWRFYESPAPPMTGCARAPFDPAASVDPTSTAPDSASGLSVDIDIPANDDPPQPTPGPGASPAEVDGYVAGATDYWRSDAGAATAHLDKTVVTLPEGMSVNPSSATGLVACSDAQMGVTAVGNPYRFNNAEPSCPDGSKLGTAHATTPLLEGSPNLTGEMYLGTPKSTDPTSGNMFRLFLVFRNQERGVLAKVYGSSVTDPATGQITATFDKNPRVPVENIEVDVKGGARGVLANPLACGQKTTISEFTPWSAAHNGGGIARTVADGFAVAGDCSAGFSPALDAGMDTRKARSSGTFSFRFSRIDGEQYLRGLTATLPKGLLASVKGLPLCTDGQADAGACPAGSRIGVVDAKAGAGDPFVLEEKGEVFLTEGYKGGSYGLAVKIRPVAGPFRGDMELSPIVVRQAIYVDRKTAQVTAVSDPFPLIHHGVPLRVREVTVLVDRSGFMLNPSDCAAKQVGADLVSDRGAVSNAANGFQASGCKGLRFEPRLALRLTGRKQVRTGKHPGIRAEVTQRGVPEAGIEKAKVTLPKSLALDVDNAQALCEFDAGTRPDLESHCPKGSIVGRARAVSPLLNDPLAGNVYFVKNVRIDKKTGNAIRTLPMIVVALRGEIAVNLIGESNTTKSGKLVNTFDQVPDAPIAKFNLNIKGGNNGILAVTRTRRGLINLCARPKSHIAEADIDGHNGRRHDSNIRMKTPCAKGKRKVSRR
jgi:hypothetical protein